MTKSQADFLATLESLRAEGDVLPAINTLAIEPRSAPHLRLNGLTVVAFACLEDFIKRRAYEVLSWMGEKQIPFASYPATLQNSVLVGTLKGLMYNLDKTDESERDVLIQLEAFLLAQAGENVGFVPSAYFFGRSSSNLSESIIKSLLQAFGFKDPDEAMNVVSNQLSYAHLGRVMEGFTLLSKNRHSSAHAFPDTYRKEDFLLDVKSRIPLIAVCFDTCLSQLALLMERNFSNKIKHDFDQKLFFEKTAIIRILDWNFEKKRWNETMRHKVVTSTPKNNYSTRVDEFRRGQIGAGNTIVLKNERGDIIDWIQPLS